MADKFEDLRTFVAVIDSGGVNAAAAALGIAKSAVSRRLRELEERLGVELITRSTRSFEPTAVGRRYYQGARALLDGVAALDAEAGGPLTPGTRVIVAVDASSGPATASALAGIAATRELLVEIVDAAGLTGGTTPDLWLGVTPDDAEAHERRAGGVAGMSTVASPAWLAKTGNIASIGDLRALTGIAVQTRIDGGWRFGDDGVHSPAITLVVPDDASAVAAAIAHGGLARVPSSCVLAPIAAGELEPVLPAREPAPMQRDIWVRRDAAGAVWRVADLLASALHGGI